MEENLFNESVQQENQKNSANTQLLEQTVQNEGTNSASPVDDSSQMFGNQVTENTGVSPDLNTQNESGQQKEKVIPEHGILNKPENHSIKDVEIKEPIIGMKVKNLIFLVAAIVTIFVSYEPIKRIWDNIFPPSTSKEKLMLSIDKKTYEIEQTFRPEQINVDEFSSPDVKLIQDFQNSVLNLVTYWKEVENIKPVEDYKGQDAFSIKSIIESHIEVYLQYSGGTVKVIEKVVELHEYGNSHSISAYKLSSAKGINLIKRIKSDQEQFNKKTEALRAKLDKIQKKYKSMLDPDNLKKHIKNPTDIESVINVFNNDTYKILEELYNVNDNIEYYEFTDELMSLLLSQNNLYTTHLRLQK